jgi:hypothetical protein
MFTNIKAAGIMLVGLSLFFGIFIFSRFLDDGQNIGFWIGIFIGGGLGVLTCFLLIINLRSKNETKKTPVQFQLLPIAVIGGLLFAHFVLNIFGMVQVSLTLLLYTFRNFCAKFTKPLNLTSVGANFDQKKNFMLK